MERITISLDEALVAEFEAFTARRGYRNRSEAIRDLIRDRLENERLESDARGHCVGTLIYIYNHAERELAARLTRAQHDDHDIAVSTLHVHLDHEHCMEVIVLKGAATRVTAFADSIIARPGVRHGKLFIVPVDVEEEAHTHGRIGSGAPHAHSRPKT